MAYRLVAGWFPTLGLLAEHELRVTYVFASSLPQSAYCTCVRVVNSGGGGSVRRCLFTWAAPSSSRRLSRSAISPPHASRSRHGLGTGRLVGKGEQRAAGNAGVAPRALHAARRKVSGWLGWNGLAVFVCRAEC